MTWSNARRPLFPAAQGLEAAVWLLWWFRAVPAGSPSGFLPPGFPRLAVPPLVAGGEDDRDDDRGDADDGADDGHGGAGVEPLLCPRGLRPGLAAVDRVELGREPQFHLPLRLGVAGDVLGQRVRPAADLGPGGERRRLVGQLLAELVHRLEPLVRRRLR